MGLLSSVLRWLTIIVNGLVGLWLVYGGISGFYGFLIDSSLNQGLFISILQLTGGFSLLFAMIQLLRKMQWFFFSAIGCLLFILLSSILVLGVTPFKIAMLVLLLPSVLLFILNLITRWYLRKVSSNVVAPQPLQPSS